MTRDTSVDTATSATSEPKGWDGEPMFCFQCEQTFGGAGCTHRAGACGKSAEVANLQDELTGALVGFARTWRKAGLDTICDTGADMVEHCLFATVTNVDFDADDIRRLTDQVHERKAYLAQKHGVEPAKDLNMHEVWDAPVDIRSLKTLILLGMRGAAAYAHHARVLGKTDNAGVDAFFMQGLAALGDCLAADELLPLVLKTGEVNVTCMRLLDEANTGAYGKPVPTEVPLSIEPGPFVVITGHDLHDLQQLLEQTDGRGVNVYTHCEMLPAHAYPALKAHPQLKGNFGNAWFLQQKEFDNIPAPIVYTTNCLMPPRSSYSDRIFVTGPVDYPGLAHVDQDLEGHKDFSAVIAKAEELGGYTERQERTGINGGSTVTPGFAHDFVLGVAAQVIDAVKAGKLRHIFLVGGCDGAKPGRNYYTEFVKATPEDSIVLTLACGKYRFNDLDLGVVPGTELPRLMDMGQCNDAYSAVVVALALADAFGCTVNDLPLTLVLSWYEQKAVAILLSLLYLGIQGIYLGPSLPAFVSPDILAYLSETFGLRPTTTVVDDLKEILGE